MIQNNWEKQLNNLKVDVKIKYKNISSRYFKSFCFLRKISF